MIPVSEPDLSGNEIEYVLDALRSTWISSSGKYLDRFEAMFAEFVGAKHAIATMNGTTALHLALVGLGIGPGDEVIVPNLTFIASANVVRMQGATPVFADVDAGTWNLAPDSVARLITPRTRAVMPVHLYGNPCDLDALNELARRHNLLVIEDAAEALGARFRQRHVGTHGIVGTFSFYGNKTITTGEGGMIVTDDSALAAHLRLLKSHGMSQTKKYWFEEVGFNYRMTNLQAAIGCAQLERIERLIAVKRNLAARYDQLLSAEFVRATEQPNGFHSYWMYSVLVPDRIDRDQFGARLRDEGVDSRPLFYPLSTMPPYREHVHELSPATQRIARQGITLPSSTRLTDEQIVQVATVANRLLER